ncbi:metallophosphoesterase [Catenisphaera adipataccumulans]|jgi:predicted MPP superfamily phosphohydrolase|uniref:Calcineurin-like phosphoesterase domain-containing protein n=1 Tax=Catenisphaera adipataccumulans TaxID=700500 RepID=A0A7W8FVV9_9FIRM|nr:metallophosphoesterase [Catenisphaera adipataccumulans]MBB5182035.1 hypothetical protein [Catenisphaera adipataccumulans]
MTKLQKRLIVILSILLVLVLCFDISLANAFYRAPNQLQVNYITLESEDIPESMNDVSILYFTDLQYGTFENKERLETLEKEIDYLEPDICIFGGDLFDTDTVLDSQTKKTIRSFLSNIDAPLGKFAVLGEKDTQDSARKQAVLKIYKQSQVEVLTNQSVLLTNRSSDGIHLVGLQSSAHIAKATAHTSGKTYDLLVCHKPDLLTDESLADRSIDFALAGHSHGTQITYPFFGGYRTEKGAEKLNRSESQDLSFDYEISAGVGCTRVNARYNADPEVDYIILQHK